MSLAFRCQVCDQEPAWEIVRQGDVAVSWACDDHLSATCDDLQRDSEITRLVVVHWAKRREVAEINRSLREIADGGTR